MRRLKPDPVAPDLIARILDAGIRAPTPGAADQQSWRFVAVTDREEMAELAAVWRSTREALLARMPDLYPNERQAASSQYLHDHFDQLPLLILGYGFEGIGGHTVVQACWSMCLAARGLGLGATYTTLLSQAAGDVARIVGIPDGTGLVLHAALPIGYPLGGWCLSRAWMLVLAAGIGENHRHGILVAG